MHVAEYTEQIRADGALMVDAAEANGLDCRIPTCPEWQMRDLVRHLGGVHRWATAHVRDAVAELIDVDLVGGWPADDTLVEWFAAGCVDLVDVLTHADAGVQCATFLPAPSPLLFWARRQAHETAIHRADAQSPGGDITPYPPGFAADGIDELLACFLVRPFARLREESPRTLGVECTDLDASWTIRISAEPAVTARGVHEADCVVHGRASDLYLAVWNRGALADLDVSGDAAVLDVFAAGSAVRWA